jgi:hypothetical protein
MGMGVQFVVRLTPKFSANARGWSCTCRGTARAFVSCNDSLGDMRAMLARDPLDRAMPIGSL